MTSQVVAVAEFDPSSYDPTEVIHAVIVAFKICGLWPINYKFRSLYLIYRFFFQLSFTYAYVGFKLLNFYMRTHLDLATVIIFESLAEISVCLRAAIFILNFDDIFDFLRRIKLFKCESEDEVNIYKKRFGLFSNVLRFYFGCAFFATFFSLCAPFFSDKPMLAYPAYYPYLDWQNNRHHFWIAYTYQLVGMLFMAHTLILLESYHIYLMVTIGAQLDILAERFRRVGKMYLDLPHDVQQEKTLEFFLDNVKNFEELSRFIDKVETVFDVQFFYQFVCSALVFCVTALQILRSNFLEEYVSLSFYVAFSATMMNEIFLPCYFGNEVTLRREQIPHAVYSSEWIHLSEKLKKNMIIFLEGLKRARILRSGKIFTLSLFSFLTVINRSYSLFAVARNFIK
ncbi:odorant receptor 94a-like [Bradysia coprophila]|uniref:odorant receptor 94a-like n=1 Tax=Bradysia coprophila TaxID=38358 RepID=UPI00187D90C8|nr:odorant receptor 94a-like [Bradysia coprophila]